MRTCVRHCTIPAQGARGRHRRVAQGYHPFCGRGTGRGRERDGGHARPCVRDPLIGTATEGALFAPAPTGVSAATHPPADPVDQQLLWGDGGGCAPCAHQAVPRRTRSRSADTASLVCELPLRVPLSLGRRLAANLEAARQTYNACLGEALRRRGLVRQAVWFVRGRATPSWKQERQAHFRAARDQHEFSAAAMQRYPRAEQGRDGRDGGEDLERRAPGGTRGAGTGVARLPGHKH